MYFLTILNYAFIILYFTHLPCMLINLEDIFDLLGFEKGLFLSCNFVFDKIIVSKATFQNTVQYSSTTNAL